MRRLTGRWTAAVARPALIGLAGLTTLAALTSPVSGTWLGGSGVAGAAPATSTTATTPAPAVLPATAAPYGISLTRTAKTIARWQSGMNAGTPIAMPSTPFRVIYPNADAPPFVFHVRSGTYLYVSVINGDDSPPVAGCAPPGIAGHPGCRGIYPTTNAAARSYLFGPAKIDAHATSITVDGRTTAIGPAYVAGPVTTAPLLDSSIPGVHGTHMVFLGAYLRPLGIGRHTIKVNGIFDGPYVVKTYGQAVHESLSFTVDVSCR